MSTLLRIENLSKVFGKKPQSVLDPLYNGDSRESIQEETGHIVSLRQISLEIQKGEIFVLMGLSGSGKSTLLRCINALVTPTTGKIWLHLNEDSPLDLTQVSPKVLREIRQKHISMVFQKYALMPWRTLVQNVAFGLEIAGYSPQEYLKIAEEKLEIVGLSPWKNRYPHELSGGMQQRVGLARALATSASILLLDEPFSALDPLTRLKMQDELLLLQKQLQKTMIFVSHDLDEALRIGSRIAILEAGQVVQVGTPEEIVTQPSSEYVQRFVQHVNPQNVLRCHSLYTPLNALSRDPQNPRKVFLDGLHFFSAELNEQEQVVQVFIREEKASIQTYSQESPIEDLSPSSFVVGSPDLLMKTATQILSRTQKPLILKEGERFLGVVGSSEILKGFSFASRFTPLASSFISSPGLGSEI
jgi:glycine betaine/proline transport system ATP-binding protein